LCLYANDSISNVMQDRVYKAKERACVVSRSHDLRGVIKVPPLRHLLYI
jgi:hypothetical protein